MDKKSVIHELTTLYLQNYYGTKFTTPEQMAIAYYELSAKIAKQLKECEHNDPNASNQSFYL